MARNGAATAEGAIAPMSALKRVKAILGGSAGNLVEWYDWFAYSSTSLYFASHFFPKSDLIAQQMQTAAIFAAGVITRPAGAALRGGYPGPVGRRAAVAVPVCPSRLAPFRHPSLP